jgi:hypothetical protein
VIRFNGIEKKGVREIECLNIKHQEPFCHYKLHAKVSWYEQPSVKAFLYIEYCTQKIAFLV